MGGKARAPSTAETPFRRKAARTLNTLFPRIPKAAVALLEDFIRREGKTSLYVDPLSTFARDEVCLHAEDCLLKLKREIITYQDVRVMVENLIGLHKMCLKRDLEAAKMAAACTRRLIIIVAEVASSLEKMSEVPVTDWVQVGDDLEKKHQKNKGNDKKKSNSAAVHDTVLGANCEVGDKGLLKALMCDLSINDVAEYSGEFTAKGYSTPLSLGIFDAQDTVPPQPPFWAYVPKMRDFEGIKVLGAGGFGIVYQATFKPANLTTTVKLVNMDKYTRQKHAAMDKILASVVRSPFVIRYFSCFRCKEEFRPSKRR